MVAQGTVGPTDLDLLHVTDDVDEVVGLIQAADAARAQNAAEPPEAVPDSAPIDD
jgi:hypothetical protein